MPAGTFDKNSPERGVGKTCDLAFGYAGGLDAWRKFQPDQFSDAGSRNLQDRMAGCASGDQTLLVRHRSCGLDCRARARPHHPLRPVAFRCAGAFLQLKLPSGRKLSYPQPRIIGDEHEQSVVFADNGAGQFKDCRHGHGAYGGLWTENVVSGIARDLLAEAMLRIEAAGYPIVLHVHDEIVAEVPEGFGSTEEFTQLMTRKPSWALELPIAASAWSGPRYCK